MKCIGSQSLCSMGNLFNKKSSKSRSSALNGFDNAFVEENVNHIPDCLPQPCDEYSSTSVHTEAVVSLSTVSPGLCLSGSKDKSVVLYNYQNSELQQKWEGHERDVTKVCYAEDNGCFFSASRDTSVRMWRRDQVTSVGQFTGHELVVTAVDVQNGHDILCTGSRDNTVKLWDIKSGKCLTNKYIPRNLVTSVKFIGTSNRLIQTGEDKDVRVFDTSNMQIVHTFPRKQYIQTSCDVTADGNYCVTASNGFNGAGCEATLWDLRVLKPVHEYKGHTECIEDCIFLSVSADNYVITCSRDCSIRVWNRDTGTCLSTQFIDGAGPLTSLMAYADGSLCVASFKNGIHHFQMNSHCLIFVSQF